MEATAMIITALNNRMYSSAPCPLSSSLNLILNFELPLISDIIDNLETNNCKGITNGHLKSLTYP